MLSGKFWDPDSLFGRMALNLNPKNSTTKKPLSTLLLSSQLSLTPVHSPKSTVSKYVCVTDTVRAETNRYSSANIGVYIAMVMW